MSKDDPDDAADPGLDEAAAPSRRDSVLRSFGRIKARSLKPNQQLILQKVLPGRSIDLADPLASAAGRPVILEIGFGAGEHLVGRARARPDAYFIGVEPFLNGMAACLQALEAAPSPANVGLHLGDARDVVAALPAASLETVYILFPDPWPKTRHQKRRLVQAGLVEALAARVAPGGRVRFATDWADYAAWTLERFTASPHFVWTAERAQHWRAPWPDHAATRYERKALGDTPPIYLDFLRVR